MIAANGSPRASSRTAALPVFRRVVRSPERWDRVEELAASTATLSRRSRTRAPWPSSCVRMRAADPLRFPDLSLAVVKLLGAGEYVVQRPGQEGAGTSAWPCATTRTPPRPTAAIPDLVTQRLVKALLAGAPAALRARRAGGAGRATARAQEDAANKVERQVRKAAGARSSLDRIGEQFDALVTGASAKGTWVRTLRPPVDGRVVAGEQGLDVGDAVRVRLVRADPARGEIDFARDDAAPKETT